MSSPGWYPDPDGTPGSYRYWTGSSWSAQTTTDPRTPAPIDARSGVPPRPEPQPKRRRNWPLIGLVAVVLAVVLVVGVVVVHGLLGDDPAADPEPTSTVSGWDDSSPLPTATPSATPSPTPRPSAKTPTPSATSVDPAPMEACPTGDPAERESHPNDGRIHGGGLSFASPGSDWDGSGYEDGLSWAYDVAGVDQSTEPGWASIMAVGALHADDGFGQPKEAAEGVMQCVATSGYYHNVTGRRDVLSRAVTVDGHSGWELRTEIRVDVTGLSVPGDLVDVIVVDTGVQGSSGMFVAAVPIGDQHRIALLGAATAGLAVD